MLSHLVLNTKFNAKVFVVQSKHKRTKKIEKIKEEYENFKKNMIIHDEDEPNFLFKGDIKQNINHVINICNKVLFIFF